MTPAVQRACDTGKPVVVFDRGVDTDCPVTFIHPIGGFAWGIDTAEFLIDNLEPGDKVVALRILPGVDVLEHRWAAAEKLFEEAGIEVVDHFTGADPAEIKSFISDELAKGDVHGVWMDAGDGAVAAIEAFEDAGVDYPVMTGEDEMSFLRKWQETGLTALAPVYSNFQWRTPLLAAKAIFAGEEVPKEWVLPQTPITASELDEYLADNDGMPDGHYAKFGGADLPGYPEVWQQRQIRNTVNGSTLPLGYGRVEPSRRGEGETMHRTLGVNTWVWTSLLTDAHAPTLLAHIADLGFGAVELPLENVGDWAPEMLADSLHETGLAPVVVGAMGPGRSLLARAGDVAATQEYLGACIDAAEVLGASVVAGPFYAPTGSPGGCPRRNVPRRSESCVRTSPRSRLMPPSVASLSRSNRSTATKRVS